MCLKIKIFSGYIILIFLLVLTICLFRKEQMKRNYLQQDEQELLHFWHLTGEALSCFLRRGAATSEFDAFSPLAVLSVARRRPRAARRRRLLLARGIARGSAKRWLCAQGSTSVRMFHVKHSRPNREGARTTVLRAGSHDAAATRSYAKRPLARARGREGREGGVMTLGRRACRLPSVRRVTRRSTPEPTGRRCGR